MKRFSNILFVSEGDVDDSRALARAATLANNNQAKLTLVAAVAPGTSILSHELREALIAESQERLQQLARSVSLTTGTPETRVLVGRPFIEVIREVQRNGRDLVVKSSGHAGAQLRGGMDIKLLRKCPCPVWIINSAEESGYRQILLALDFEPENPENEPLNRQLVEMAASLALSEFAELHVVHAWKLEHEGFFRSARSGLTREEVDQMVTDEENRRRRWLEQFVNDCCGSLGAEASGYLQPEFHLIQGYAEDVVPGCATDLGAELIVMGTVGRTGIPGFVIGNTADTILQRIDCSVLAVKPAGFVSPVTADS